MWRRPPQDSDKLYMNVGEGDLIEVGHPQPKPGQEDPSLDNVKNDTCFLPSLPIALGRTVQEKVIMRCNSAASKD